MSKPAKKKIKEIKVDLSKCNGCRACEKACAAFHAIPKYSSFNPARSRIGPCISMGAVRPSFDTDAFASDVGPVISDNLLAIERTHGATQDSTSGCSFT